MVRKIVITLLGLVIIFLAILQTNFCKGKLKETIVQRAKEQGIELSIDQLDGKLPFSLSLQGVKSGDLVLDQVEGRLSFFNWGAIHLGIKEASYLGIPFSGQGDLFLARGGISISNLQLEGAGAGISGWLNLGKRVGCELNFLVSELGSLQRLFPFPVAGSLSGEVELFDRRAKLNCFSQDLTVAHYPFAETHLSVQAEAWDEGWQGALTFEGGHEKIPISSHLVFNFHEKSNLFSIEELTFNGPDTEAGGALTINPLSGVINGKVSLLCKDLKKWRPIYPLAKWGGRLEGDIEFAKEHLKASLSLENPHFFEMQAERVVAQFQAKNLREGHLTLEGAHFKSDELAIDSFNFSTLFGKEGAPFELSCKGSWRDPLELRAAGALSLTKELLKLDLKEVDGFAIKKRLHLQEPFELLLATDHFKLNPFKLLIGNGELSGRIDLTPDSTAIRLKGEKCPIDFLSLALPHSTMHGLANVDIDLLSWENNLQGICTLTLDSGELIPFGRKSPLRTQGRTQLHFEKNQMQIHSSMRADEGQFVELSGSFPIEFHHFPFRIAIDEKRPFASDLTFEGRLEDLTQFINIGPQRVEGWLSAHLNFSKNNLRGEVEIQEGLYENYASGTLLKNIAAKGKAEGSAIMFPELSARGRDGKGTLQGSGRLSFFPKFQFLVDAELQHLTPVSDHTIVAEVSGHAILEGDRSSMKARGDLEVDELLFLIPDHLPTELPTLPITFINPPDCIEHQSTPSQRYPFNLDINLDAPKNVLVAGKGLQSELAGKLHITGTYTNIAAEGKLSLIKGEYLFCGKVFTLNQGEVICKEKPKPSASITLSGSADLADVTATITLRGPLSAPALTFQSIPQLSTSSLLARLLFNKDISEISPLQGLQLAQTLMSLTSSSGLQLDIFERLRKALHVDRLTLLTSENDPGKISVQIGKYLMRGVLLTLVQGVSSRNVAVEVELARGFTLQAEMNETQQGKFSLKWHHYY